MSPFTTVIAAALVMASSLLVGVRGESHQVTVSHFSFQYFLIVSSSKISVQFTNNCGHGTPLFLYQGNGNPQAATTIQGQLNGGIAWLGNQGNCQSSGVNCGAVEFTLENTGFSQADFTLETGPDLGNHQLYVLYEY